jgi:hypothetical protein
MLLQNLQTEFVDYLLSEDNSATCKELQPIANMPIYRNNVISNLVNTLLNTYPLITRLVGLDFFRIAAKDYIKRYPSCSSNLHEYGQYFNDFLAVYPPVKSLPYLTEVAFFEWTCHTLHFAASPSPFDNKLLATLSPDHYPHLHFVLHPASHVSKFHYPILRIIELCKEEINDIIDMNGGGDNLLIIRRDLEIMLVSLNAAEYAFLMSLQTGLSLSKALDAAKAMNVNFKLDEKLPAWIQDKTIVDVYAAVT